MRRWIGAGLRALRLQAAAPALSGVLACSLALVAPVVMAASDSTSAQERESHLKVPMPDGFRVEHSELEGPVFADARGMTLYYWPLTTMRNGVTGDAKNTSACTHKPTTHTAGLMSPYPPGLKLPELDRRLSCAEVWPPVLAPEGATPVGAFSIITRTDGTKQWAYDGHALYTSILDEQPGDVRGASSGRRSGEGPAPRVIAAPPPAIPPGFAILTTTLGRQLLTDRQFSVYWSEHDGPEQSKCDKACERIWKPVLAAAASRSRGEWTTFERTPGVFQWAFRKRPLYTNVLDATTASLQGSDEPGWHNAYTQRAPSPPEGFTAQDSISGVVLADAEGRTIYVYNCGDDSADQLACNHPNAPQAYRFAICGGGDVQRCLQSWPYVTAASGAQSNNRIWTVIEINPLTGRFAEPGDAQTLRVWAYRGSPVYTHAGDERPGDMNGDGNGEFGGGRNGFQVFYLRDELLTNGG